jgi:hypothetical protein
LINSLLHRQPVALDSALHRDLKVSLPITDWSMASRLNAIFLAATEFSDACLEYPIFFVKVGEEVAGVPQIAPIAVLGVNAEQNLYLQGTSWRASYLPALLRAYPFCIGRMDEQRFAVCVDTGWDQVNTQEGQALFQPDGQPTELTKSVQAHFETMEAEIQRTRLVCQRLQELDVLREMRLDATLPDGRQHTIDGFLTVDQEKMQGLDDKVVLELHRNGVLGLIHRHWVSLAHMQRLVQWHGERTAVAAPGTAAATTH